MSSSVVQYIVVRKDLLKLPGWSTGALITQACHACVAAIHQFYEHEDTRQYLLDIDRMHKVTLQVNDEDGILKLTTKLKEDNIDHKLWIEQPENIPTCIATRPYSKDHVQKYFKELKLFRS